MWNNCLKTVRKRPCHLPFVKASHSCRPASLNIFLRYPFRLSTTLWSLSGPPTIIPRAHKSLFSFISSNNLSFPFSRVSYTNTRDINPCFTKSRIHANFSQIYREKVTNSPELFWNILLSRIHANFSRIFSKSRIPGNFSQIYYYREFLRTFLKSIISREVTDSREYFVELIESRKLQEHQRANVIFLRMFSFWNTLVKLDPDAVIFDILRPRMTSSHLDFIDISR